MKLSDFLYGIKQWYWRQRNRNPLNLPKRCPVCNKKADCYYFVPNEGHICVDCETLRRQKE